MKSETLSRVLNEFYWLGACREVTQFCKSCATCQRTNQNEPRHEISNNVVCATSKGSDQPSHMRSLIRAFEY